MSETAQNTDSALQATPRRGWFGRNWKWCIPLLLLVLIVLGAFIAALPHLKRWTSKPYKTAVAAVQADPAVIEKLGEPVKAGWTLSGNLTEYNCLLNFDVIGPKGKAKVSAQARTGTDPNVWSFSLIEVTFDDASKVTVETATEEGGLEDAPAWGE